jgi:hypothetical protein
MVMLSGLAWPKRTRFGEPEADAHGVTSEGSIIVITLDVIQRLNQTGTNSNKFYLNSKTRTEFEFSFEFY